MHPARFLPALAGGLLTAALGVGPLLYGSTRPGALWLLVAVLGTAALCWTAGRLVRRRLPRTPPVLLAGLALLALSLLPWLGIFSPTPVADFTRAHFARIAARWPASVIAAEPGALVALAAGLGFALWITADLARQRRWLLIFTTTLTVTAVIVTLLAFRQIFSSTPGIYWADSGRLPGRVWGPFFHHTSAGAYLNSAWPLAAGLIFVCARRRATTGLILAGLAVVLLLAAHATHLARFAPLAALAAIPVLLWRFALLRSRSGRIWGALGLAGVLILGAAGGRLPSLAERWQLLRPTAARQVQPIPPEQTWPGLVRADLLIANVYNAGRFGDRGEVQQTAWRAIAARPFTGHGPGNWRGAASWQSRDPYVRSFYLHLQFTHADFLQAWVERGAAGAGSLALLLGGGLVAVWRARPVADPVAGALGFCAATGLTLVLVQALFDFPLQIPAVALSAHVLAGLGWACAAGPAVSVT